MFKGLFNRKKRSTKKVTTIWDKGRVIGRIIEGGPTGPTYNMIWLQLVFICRLLFMAVTT